MGKIKVSFTTALFVFSFLVCVIVAIVFVDRSAKNDYDSFYDAPAANAEQAGPKGAANSGWDPAQAAAPASAPQTPASDAALSDLPIDAHLAALAVPVAPAAGVTPVAPAANPMAGRSPEDIARTLMDQGGRAAALQGVAVPGMAVPAGVATPAGGVAATGQIAPVATPRVVLPMQSNVQGNAPPGVMPNAGSGFRAPSGLADPSAGLTNTGTWSPVAAQPTNSNLIGIHKVPSGGQAGMMIGEGRIETGAQAPSGFSDLPVNAGTSPVPSLQGGSPGTALPGSMEKPLLLPPQSESGASKWELPPAPTLRPPPIQDPDQRRSEANETPGSLNPEEESFQAFAISEAETSGTSAEPEADLVAAAIEATATPPAPAEDVAARVKEATLSKTAALRLARVDHKLNDKTLAKDAEEDEAEKAAVQWKEIQAAAEQARAENLVVGAPDIESYAGRRPDFDPAEWQLTMEEEGFSTSEIREYLEAVALSEKLIETKFTADVNDDEIKKAYEKAPSKYATPRKIRLQEIYKAKPSDADRAQRVEREMKRLQRQAASGTDFGLLARQASEAPTAKRSGHLGWIDPAKDKDSLRDKAIASLKEGEVSEVIDEDSGFRIYRLAEDKPAASDYDGAKETVIAELKKPVRKDVFTDVLKKLEAGELNSKPAAASGNNMATAAVPKASPVVRTRPGSSLVSANTEAAPESAAPVGASQAGISPGNSSEPGDPLTDPETAKKFKAQQLLGEANARREAEERGEVYVPPTDLTAAATGTVTHEPGQQTQLLYAPGTQVQQMGAEQSMVQPQAMGSIAAPMQASMQMPNQASVNYDPNLPGAQPAPAALAITPPPGYTPMQERPRQSQTQSNGWTVTKTTVDDEERARRSAAAAEAGAGAEFQGPAPAGSIPPGFEGSVESAGSAPPQEQPRRRGIVGNVRSFFGNIGR